MTTEPDILEPPAKVDPDTLALRATPRRVVRFRRGLMIAIAAGGAASVATIAWVALQPAGLRWAAAPEIHVEERQRPPEAVEALPGSYGQLAPEVPRLGPPLPGDLGRPILARQDQTPETVSRGEETALDAAAAERDRRIAEREQARRSPPLVQLSQLIAAIAPDGVMQIPAPAPPGDVPSDAPGQDRNLAFLVGRPDGGSVNPHRLEGPASPWQLSAGSIISASLLTGLDSDLPGTVVAQVTEPVYDSATGTALLIPQGARLIGRYNSVVAFGQRRALVVWQRLILPDASSIALDNFAAADPAGYAGLADTVDFHTGRLIQGIGLSTLLGVGTELSLGDTESELVRALREAAQQNAARAGERLVERNLDIQPTIRIRPGFPLRVMVHKDVILKPWREDGDA